MKLRKKLYDEMETPLFRYLRLRLAFLGWVATFIFLCAFVAISLIVFGTGNYFLAMITGGSAALAGFCVVEMVSLAEKINQYHSKYAFETMDYIKRRPV